MFYCKFKCDKAKCEEIRAFYKAALIENEKNPYDYFLTRHGQVTIHAYKNNKEIYTVLFSSIDESAVLEAKQFSSDFVVTKSDEKDKSNASFGYEDIGRQIGSDEVGVGDFFGPLVVVACYFQTSDLDFVKKYHIDDSKKMNDDYILSIGPIVKRRVKNFILSLSPLKLSSLHDSGFNMHKIMAISHNYCHKKLVEKYSLPSTLIYIDQFAKEDDYLKYVGEDLIEGQLIFKTKGESYYPSVALASVLARYTFLKEFSLIEERFQTEIPKGAGKNVDKVFGYLRNKYGLEALKPFVKSFFANYDSKEGKDK